MMLEIKKLKEEVQASRKLKRGFLREIETLKSTKGMIYFILIGIETIAQGIKNTNNEVFLKILSTVNNDLLSFFLIN